MTHRAHKAYHRNRQRFLEAIATPPERSLDEIEADNAAGDGKARKEAAALVARIWAD